MLPAFATAADLQKIEARLAAAPDDISLRYHRAYILDLLGRNNDARDAYIDVIKRDGTHLGALGNLGTLLYNAGYRSAARLTYAEALKHHPNDVQTLVNLGNALHENAEYDAARQLFDRAISLDSNCAAAHQGLSHTLDRLGESERAAHHRQIGFTLRPITLMPFRGEGVPVEVLVLASALRGNVPFTEPLDDQTFMTIYLFADHYDRALPLPPHHVIVNGIGDADLCDASLVAAEALLAIHHEPVINAPAKVHGTGRLDMARRLRGIEGLIVPALDELTKVAAARIERFPVLLRPPGYHTGEYFERAECRDELERVLAALPGDRVLSIEQLNVRSADGLYRKYRLLCIGGVMYPVHLARSSTWKVHYFSADLVRTPDAVAEEEAFLRDPRSAIGERAMRALEIAADRIALDYFGIDFGIDIDGNALFFEANATMRAVVPHADGTNEARRRAAIKANAAFKELVLARRLPNQA